MENSQNRSKIGGRLIVAAVIAVLLAVLIIAGLVFYRYARNQLYEESISQLGEISTQLFEKLDVQLELQWGYLDKLKELRTDNGTMTTEELSELLSHAQQDLGPEGEVLYIRAIDEYGNYYTTEGRRGIWTGLDRLDLEDAQQSFLIANWLDDENYMAFTQELSCPLTVDGRKILRFVLLRSMTDMGPFFHSSVFDANNMVYVTDPEGLTMYADGSLEGIDFEGRNIFHNLREQTYPHMGSFDAVTAAVKNEEGHSRVYTDVVINGESYYLIYDLLPDYDWSVVILISSSDVAVNATHMVSSMLRVFVIVAGLLVLVTLAAFFMLGRFRSNRRLLELKEENEKILEEANSRLEETNSELEQAQRETAHALALANEATKAKSQFLANMSHDIRTPMNAIVGIGKLMESDVDNHDRQLYYIKKLQQSSKYMLGLINDILDMSKIESGEVHLNLESVKLAEQVGQIESIIRSQSNEKHQTFTISVHNIVHEYLIGDSIRLRQIFLNLLVNAVKYTQDGGDIRFELTELPCEREGYATFHTAVIDNGYGMSAEFLTHLFEPFMREENSVTNKTQGTGLGMSITKSLVDLMGGTITVQSELNKGSRFEVTLTLPIDTAAMHGDAVSSALLISKEETLAENVRAALSEEHVELRVAETPEAAVPMLREKMADVILLSGYLCDENLSEIVAILKEADKDAMLVFCCDYAHREHVREVIANTGVDGFIARPFFLENLLIAVRNVRRNTLPPEEQKHSPLAGKRFLCAEDNELNAEILEALLTMQGASCVIYPSGVEIVEAFESVREGDFDAILMDVQMPKMNGMDATRRIRRSANPLGKTIPIIAMTANAFSSDVQDCLQSGMDAHLAKPLDLTALERTLHELTSDNVRSGGGTSSQPTSEPADEVK